MPLPAVEKEEKRQIGRTACSHRSGCELVLKQAVQPQRVNPQCTRSAGQIMNDSIVGCYGDLTLNKLKFFFPSKALVWHGGGDLKRIIAELPYRSDFISEQADFEGKQKKKAP